MATTELPAETAERDYAGEAAAWLSAFNSTPRSSHRPRPSDMTAERLLVFALVQATIGQARATERQTEAIEAQTAVLRDAWIDIPSDIQAARRPWWRFWGGR